MVSYLDNYEIAIFNGVKYRLDKKTGYYLHSKSNGQTGTRLHRDVYIFYHGEIPQGMQIHHKDHDKNNNEIDNLVCLTPQEHYALHEKEKSVRQKIERLERWNKNVQESAKQLKSRFCTPKCSSKCRRDSGIDNVIKTCPVCNKEFISNKYSKTIFCSRSCTNKGRTCKRKAGV